MKISIIVLSSCFLFDSLLVNPSDTLEPQIYLQIHALNTIFNTIVDAGSAIRSLVIEDNISNIIFHLFNII